MFRFVVVAAFALAGTVGSAQPFEMLATDETMFGSRVFYRAQPARDGVVVLNANNGFFDKGAFRAEGKIEAPADEKALISSHFTHLVPTANTAGAARWYVWIPRAGTVEFAAYFRAPKSANGQTWTLAVGDAKREIRLRPGDETQSQGRPERFRIDSPGKYPIALSRAGTSESASVDFFRLVLRGDAIEKASLLRARWRPAAVHTQYHSSTCPTTKLWVFESQNVSNVSSYSPMTTRFGYFGGSFSADGRASGGVNFSMWAAGRNATEAPPLSQMPHLLATGNPQAEFSGFGHEGSGVKIRNWEPYSHHPKSIVQALRVETSDGYDTYTGYLFDDRIDRWVLYAVGRRPVASSKRGGAAETVLRPNSFCEVPGPPNVERTGDQPRTMRRRGWFYGSDQKWHAVDRQTVGIRPKDAPVNKFIGVDDDGWFVMGTGGMEMLDGTKEVSIERPSRELPPYLRPAKARQLFESPVAIGQSNATDVTNQSATVNYELNDLGESATATLHYGVDDCVTFVSRKLHGTEKRGLSSELLSRERTWSKSTQPMPIENGTNRFSLTDLNPGTTYYYRVLVVDDDGKMWADRSGSFATK